MIILLLILAGCAGSRDIQNNKAANVETNLTHSCDVNGSMQDEQSHQALVKKPAIYLYPPQKENINVSLQIDGEIVTSIPPYDSGWSVEIDSDGIINAEYDYLFYENTLNRIELPDEGWIVQGEDMRNWFEIILPKLGLNTKEARQFKEYWLANLDKSKLYEIKLFSHDFLTKNMTLNITPKPDIVVRVIFNFKTIDKAYYLQEPSIETPSRVGFHVLEWGGRIESE